MIRLLACGGGRRREDASSSLRSGEACRRVLGSVILRAEVQRRGGCKRAFETLLQHCCCARRAFGGEWRCCDRRLQACIGERKCSGNADRDF
jgi:hypothetical protein